MSSIARHRQARPHLELKTQTRFFLLSLSLNMQKHQLSTTLAQRGELSNLFI
jgi:hypothetical protein